MKHDGAEHGAENTVYKSNACIGRCLYHISRDASRNIAQLHTVMRLIKRYGGVNQEDARNGQHFPCSKK